MSEILGSDFFWSTIEQSKGNQKRLEEILATLSEEEIVQFHNDFVTTTAELKYEPFTDLMVESEDGIDDVANWVVSQGRDYYESVLADPSSIPYEVDESDKTILSGVAGKVFYARFGKVLSTY